MLPMSNIYRSLFITSNKSSSKQLRSHSVDGSRCELRLSQSVKILILISLKEFFGLNLTICTRYLPPHEV